MTDSSVMFPEEARSLLLDHPRNEITEHSTHTRMVTFVIRVILRAVFGIGLRYGGLARLRALSYLEMWK